MSDLRIDEATADDADLVRGVIHRAFSARPVLDPPSTATQETVDTVHRTIATDGALIVRRRGVAVGAVLFDLSRPGQLGLRRVSVDPFQQSHGVASAMVGVAEDIAEARGLDGVWLTAREELPENLTFWERRGYWQAGWVGPTVELAKTLWLARQVDTAVEMRAFGATLSTLLAEGDLVVLTGELGAGKTTLVQGIGSGLGVQGQVTSPTFVIARLHPARVGRPLLLHADAYRLGGTLELDDLDLDASVHQAVTVVEWGKGLAEGLADHRLEVRIDRLLGDGTSAGRAALAAAGPERTLSMPPPKTSPTPESRVVSVRPFGARWAGVTLRSTLLT